MAAEKNLEGNDFALLHRLSDSHLITVMHDSGLAFMLESGSAEEIIPLIRAKEAAQAALAQAAARQAEALAKSAKDTDNPDSQEIERTNGQLEATPHTNNRGKGSAMLEPRRGRSKVRRSK